VTDPTARAEAKEIADGARPELAPAAPTAPPGTPAGWRRWVLLALVLGVLVAMGLGGYSACRSYVGWRHARRADEALKRGDLKGAHAELGEYLAIWPNNAEHQFLAARTARRLWLYDEAEDHLNRCRNLGYDQHAITLEWRLMRAQRGDAARAEKQLKADLEKEGPDSVLIYEALAQGYMISLWDLPAALKYLDKWLEKDPRAVQALVWRGEVYERLNNKENALSHYRQAVDLDADHFDARLHLARALLQANQAPQASGHFERLQQAQPDHPGVLLGLAQCRLHDGRPNEAAALLDHCLELHPDNMEALRERGRLAFYATQPERAESLLRRAIKLDPHDPPTNLLLSQCLDQVNKKRLRPFAATAPWVYAYYWLRELEAKAYRSIYDVLMTDAQRLDGLFGELVRNPNCSDPAVYYEIGMIFLRSGQAEEARNWLERCLAFDPQYRPARDELERLGGAR
jgi:tetratricopeptide (TPR) repeat protein